MRLLLINPVNPLALSEIRQRWFNRYRVWKPLGLQTVAALTPAHWDLTLIDENLGVGDYEAMPRPDLVGITAFTSQASRAYELAAYFRKRGVRVVMGGIHASMCPDEARRHVDGIVIGEAEDVWPRLLADVEAGALQQTYQAPRVGAQAIPAARHDLLARGYAFGAIQTTRGCPLNCNFCSVTAFNGARYRQRPIADVVAEMAQVRQKMVLVVDDNLIGTSPSHIARAKTLFRAMIDAKLGKKWIAQVTINMGDDEELLALAAKAGCIGVFIGFESSTPEGLAEIGKKFNVVKGRDMRSSVRRIQRHRILVVGSFIIGLDDDRPGIGRRIADAASRYGVDLLNVLFLTPLPGTKLWDKLLAEGRIRARNFPHDWRYYTLTFPVAHYKHLSQAQVSLEMSECDRRFYSARRMTRRIAGNLLRWRHPLFSLVGNISYRASLRANRASYQAFAASHGEQPSAPPSLLDRLFPAPSPGAAGSGSAP